MGNSQRINKEQDRISTQEIEVLEESLVCVCV